MLDTVLDPEIQRPLNLTDGFFPALKDSTVERKISPIELLPCDRERRKCFRR